MDVGEADCWVRHPYAGIVGFRDHLQILFYPSEDSGLIDQADMRLLVCIYSSRLMSHPIVLRIRATLFSFLKRILILAAILEEGSYPLE